MGELQDWQLRVVKERDELKRNTGNLGIFLETESFKNLSSLNRTLLKAQYRVMVEFLEILEERINLF